MNDPVTIMDTFPGGLSRSSETIPDTSIAAHTLRCPLSRVIQSSVTDI